MDEKKRTMRGIPLDKQRLWSYFIEIEEKLRLKWFKKNEARLDEIANKVHLRQVPDEVKEELKERMNNYFKTIEKRHTVMHDDAPPIVEEAALQSIMRPVDKHVKDLLYASAINEGRKAYLQERYKIIPEKRYYFPETTSFQYGWSMSEFSKNIKGSPFARQQIIKESFYRRRGVAQDPEWYKEPAKLSPQVCGRI
ncbi:protein ATP6V1FNB-like [Tribolium madens]|uniref:protein ATP6V1FNB-like n=1 Tax=Tribolium madens TaxID=41895 RepID=UPI001CF751F8|nr:protein ATP6V1FNB-like [Tribolium madens]